MEKKRDKKKLLVLGLLLFAVVGLAGYGVYSYYYTEGTMSTEEPSDDSDNVIHITGKFNPTVIDYSENTSGTEEFLGHGGSLILDCPDNVGANETFTCTASTTVSNDGTTPVRVSYHDFSPHVSSDDAEVSIESSSIDWSSHDDYEYPEYTTLGVGESTSINIEVQVKVGDSGSVPSGTAQLVTAPVSGGSISAYADFRLEAYQINN